MSVFFGQGGQPHVCSNYHCYYGNPMVFVHLCVCALCFAILKPTECPALFVDADNLGLITIEYAFTTLQSVTRLSVSTYQHKTS